MQNDCVGPIWVGIRIITIIVINAGPLEVLDPLRPHTSNALYMEKKGRWRGAIRDLKDGMEEYEIIKGYRVRLNRKRNNEISESIVEQ